MPRPRRCQPREGQYHHWILAGDHWICERCKEPGPDVNDVLLDVWEASAPRHRTLEDRAAFLVAQIERAEGVLQNFEDAAVVMEAEMAAAGVGPLHPPGRTSSRRPKSPTEVELSAIAHTGIARVRRLTWWVLVDSPTSPQAGLAGFVCEEDARRFLRQHFQDAIVAPTELHEAGTERARWILRVKVPQAAGEESRNRKRGVG